MNSYIKIQQRYIHEHLTNWVLQHIRMLLDTTYTTYNFHFNIFTDSICMYNGKYIEKHFRFVNSKMHT